MAELIQQHVNVEDVERANMYGGPELGIATPVPFGLFNRQWEDLKEAMVEGDELWFLKHSNETRGRMFEMEEYVVKRGDEIVKSMVTELSYLTWVTAP